MDLHTNDRPRERLAALGPQALSNIELIAILLRFGVPGENAVQVGQRLHRALINDLKRQYGLGEA